jgi:hypothetical protein
LLIRVYFCNLAPPFLLLLLLFALFLLTMDAGSHSICSEKNSAAEHRLPLQEAGSRPYMPSLSTTSRNPAAKCYVSSQIRNPVDACVRKLFDGIA